MSGGGMRQGQGRKRNGGSAAQEAALLEQALDDATDDQVRESAMESAIEDDAYERILVNTPDTLRDIMKDVIVEKYMQGAEADSGAAAGGGYGAIGHAPDGAEGLQRSLSHPTLPEAAYPELQHASDINVPGGFRRDFVINDADDEERVPDVATVPFLTALLQNNEATLYAWVENAIDSEDEESDLDSDEDDGSRTTRSGRDARYNMVFSSYGRRSLHRRASDFANDEAIKAGPRKTVFTLFKCFVATGIMFLPSGFRNAGLLAGCLTILIVGAISLYGMNLLIQTRTHMETGVQPASPRTPLLSSAAAAAVSSTLFPRKPVQVQSYSQLGYHTVGYYGKRVVEASILFSQIGFCCVYISFIGNTLSEAISKNLPEGEQGLALSAYMLLAVPVVTPLTFIRHLKHFAVPNFIANVFVLVALVYIFYRAATVIAEDRGTADWSCDPSDPDHTVCSWINLGTFPMFLGSSVYVFEGITMVIPIQNSMREPERLPGMLKGVVSSVTIVFCLFGTLNFYAYAQDTKPIVIDNLPKRGGLVVTLMFVLVALFMFPLMIFPAARIIEKRLFKKLRRSGFKWQKNFIRTCIVMFCVAVSIAAGTKVDKLVAVIGGLFCVPLALVYPPLFFLKSGCAQDFWTERLPATALLATGVVSACLSTAIAIAQF